MAGGGRWCVRPGSGHGGWGMRRSERFAGSGRGWLGEGDRSASPGPAAGALAAGRWWLRRRAGRGWLGQGDGGSPASGRRPHAVSAGGPIGGPATPLVVWTSASTGRDSSGPVGAGGRTRPCPGPDPAAQRWRPGSRHRGRPAARPRPPSPASSPLRPDRRGRPGRPRSWSGQRTAGQP